MSWGNRLFTSLRSRRIERDLDDELAFHVEMKSRELIAGGMGPEQARRQARLTFGNLTLMKERTREMNILPALESLAGDCRYSLRSLRKSPGFTVVAVLTLALGIGANTAVFSLVYGLLIRPLPYPDAHNLVHLMAIDGKGRPDLVSDADLRDWSRQSKTLQDLSSYMGQSVNLTGEREPERLNGAFVSARFFDLLGARATIGRTFQRGDDEPGAAAVAVASHSLWQTTFGGAPDFLGHKLILNGEPFTVIGVLPQDFHFPWSDSEIWIPFRHYPNYRPGDRGGNAFAFGRVRRGHTHDQAQAEMDSIARNLAAQFPDTNRDRRVRLRELQEFLGQDLSQLAPVLMGAVAFVFCIACANLGNLALSRALSREHELGIRSALGAGAGRLLRQLLAETLLLSIAGACLGMLVAYWGTEFLRHRGPVSIPVGTPVGLNAVTVSVGFLLALLAGLVCGGVPAVHVLRRGRTAAFREPGRTASESRRRGLTRRVLVVAEISLSLVLLTGATLLLKSFLRLSAIDPGFRVANLLTLEYRVPKTKYPRPEQQWNFHQLVIERVRQVPGVHSASAVLALPFSGNSGSTTFVLADRPEPPLGSEFRAALNRAAPGWFETMRIPLLRGRFIDERDHAGSAPAAVVSRSFAERYWPGQDPIGRHVRLPEFNDTTVSVVGVAGDIRHRHLEDTQQVQIYLACAQQPHLFSTLVVETHGDPMSYANAVRRAVWSVDNDQPVWKVRSLESLVDGYLRWRGFLPELISGFSAFALLLAALGIYGVLSYSTGRRTRAFGLRLAVGATPGNVLRLVMADGVVVTLLGLAIGAAGALALSGLLEKQLYGIRPTDPLSFALAALLLAAVALLAAYLPAHRAVRVDPVAALRHD